jgi:hypothetical protein
VSNPFLIQNPLQALQPTLGLSQIEGFSPVKEFTDSTGVVWQLKKSAFDSSVGIPDPTTVSFTDHWCREIPNASKTQKIYCYCAEGIKQPMIEGEKPTRVLYHWFCLTPDPQFTPAHVSQQEWHRANVYAAAMTDDARVSKFNALCGIQQQPAPADPIDNHLIRLGNDGEKKAS